MGYLKSILVFCFAVVMFSQISQCNNELATRTYEHPAVGDIIMLYFNGELPPN